jgi:hypothetical protein
MAKTGSPNGPTSDDDQYLPDDVAALSKSTLKPFKQLAGYMLKMVSSLGDRQFGLRHACAWRGGGVVVLGSLGRHSL